jgi:hypothetical protein
MGIDVKTPSLIVARLTRAAAVGIEMPEIQK